jgi:RNA polymerase sigma-70 factor (ECF subfamily)
VLRSVAAPHDDPAEPWAQDPVVLWVEQIQAGHDVERNFEQLYKHFHPKLIRYFSSRGFDPGRCEEITQEVFLSVFKGIGSLQERCRFAGWLFEIAHNLYANELRRISAAKRDGYELPLQEESDAAEDEPGQSAPPLAAQTPSPYDEVKHREETAALHQALATLPTQMRRCAILRLCHDLKYREVAEVMNVSLDTVKAHLSQAKARLQRLLTDGVLRRLADDSSAEPES